MLLDLTKPEHAYFYGFSLGDGTLREQTRNRGKLSIELSQCDEELLIRFQKLFDCNATLRQRTRDTNFKKNSTTSIFSIHDWGFRKELKSYGFPVGKKSDIVDIPNGDFSEEDFIRGLFDADGSVGFDKQNIPFISFCSKSDNIVNYLKTFLKQKLNIEINPHRNKRDNIYNITIYCEKSQQLIKLLYYPNSLSLYRKYSLSEKILNWTRPLDMRIRPECKSWTDEEDHVILNNSIEDSIKKLNRTEKSIKMRIWRLTKCIQ